MLEILFLIGAVGAIGLRAQQRGTARTPFVAAALAGWGVLLLASVAGLGMVGLILRWLWIGGVYLYLIRFTHGGAKVEDRWQCPDCRLFNDAETLVCLCGYQHPGAPEEARSQSVRDT